MMTPDPVMAACDRLRHEWELRGASVNPAPVIRRIAGALVPVSARPTIEAHLHDEWARLCALEGDERDE